MLAKTIDQRLLSKFSVGLNLDASIKELDAFYSRFGSYIESVYYSVPLGRRYYSRDSLADEFDRHNPDFHLASSFGIVKSHGIQMELAANTVGLSHDDLFRLKTYVIENNVYPDSIVCLPEYADFFKRNLPNTRLRLSFNASCSTGVSADFDSVVVGKNYLRSGTMRKNLVDSGIEMVLLLNAGCSFSCKNGCGNAEYCKSILDANLEHFNVNELYAQQSFFPIELTHLLNVDPCANQYKFKISNRTLGLGFTEYVLSAYLAGRDIADDISISQDYYGPFCLMRQLLLYRQDFDYETIMNIKRRCGYFS